VRAARQATAKDRFDLSEWDLRLAACRPPNAASRPGLRSTFQNSGTAISIGVFFTLENAGLASSPSSALRTGPLHAGVPHTIVAKLAGPPPVSSMFGALLGINPGGGDSRRGGARAAADGQQRRG
jgi:hypothetical protein